MQAALPTSVTQLWQNSTKLRDLIIAVRTCKTSAEERATIQRESVAIRESFATGKDTYRHRNMLKLMYMSMLGYSTEWAQMEVVKMLAKPDYADKRIGYLALCILLDETTEVLTLAENGIKRDLSDKQAFTQALALATVANVAGEDMARDVMSEVSGLVLTPNKNVQKKAALAALRIVRRVPEFAEVFLEKMTDLLQEQQHGALISGLTLVIACLETGTANQYMKQFRGMVPQAIRLLKSLVLSATSHDSDIQGVANPFLQVRLLEFLRVVAKDDPHTSDSINDILAQVATNTESSKSVGFAILFECARTIFSIQADDGLKVLGINILARFLTSTKDNNLRYVALSSLLQVYSRDPEAVKRHQATIIDCLKDADISIRKRALDLTVALIDEHSVRSLTPDLLIYLSVCGDEMKPIVTERICEVVERQAPTPEWRVEMSLRVFKAAKAFLSDEFATRFIAHVTNQNNTTKAQAVQSLWEEVSLPYDAQMNTRHAMLLAAVWCVGEYCDLLVRQNGGSLTFAEAVASCIYGVINNAQDAVLKQYCLTCLAKIVCKFPQTRPVVFSVFETQATNLDCELQQRAIEYASLLEFFPELAVESLAPIPPIVPATEEPPAVPSVAPYTNAPPPVAPLLQTTAAPPPKPAPPKTVVNVFDDLFAPTPVAAQPPQYTQPPASTSNGSYGGLFDSPPRPQPQQQPQTVAPPLVSSQQQTHDDIFGPMSGYPKPTPAVPLAARKVEIHRCQDFAVTLELGSRSLASSDTSSLDFVAEVTTTGPFLTDFQFLIAVPKTVTVDIKPPTNTNVSTGQPFHQLFTLDNRNDPNNGKTILLRVRIVYKSAGVEKVAQFQLSKDIVEFR